MRTRRTPGTCKRPCCGRHDAQIVCSSCTQNQLSFFALSSRSLGKHPVQGESMESTRDLQKSKLTPFLHLSQAGRRPGLGKNHREISDTPLPHSSTNHLPCHPNCLGRARPSVASGEGAKPRDRASRPSSALQREPPCQARPSSGLSTLRCVFDTGVAWLTLPYLIPKL